MICTNCHTPINPAKKFCGKCGTALSFGNDLSSIRPASLLCSKCGAELASGKKFCGRCGSPTAALPTPRSGARGRIESQQPESRCVDAKGSAPTHKSSPAFATSALFDTT